MLQHFDIALKYAQQARSIKDNIEVNVLMLDLYNRLSIYAEAESLLRSNTELMKYLQRLDEMRKNATTDVLSR